MAIKVEFPDNKVEINNTAEFRLTATALGVEVGKRGRLPVRALIEAIRKAGLTIVDTDYFAAHMADTGQHGSDYGRELAALKEKRDKAIEDARDAYDRARDALRSKHGVKSQTAKSQAATTEVEYVVSAVPPQVKDGTVQMVKDGSKPRFLPSERRVTVTPAEVRELVDTGSRGRLSESAVVTAAVVKGGWLPKDVLSEDGWTALLKPDTLTVERVEKSVA